MEEIELGEDEREEGIKNMIPVAQKHKIDEEIKAKALNDYQRTLYNIEEAEASG